MESALFLATEISTYLLWLANLGSFVYFHGRHLWHVGQLVCTSIFALGILLILSGETFGFKGNHFLLSVGAVPVWVPLLWSLVITTATAPSHRLQQPGNIRFIGAFALDALMVFSAGLVIEPLGLRLRFWEYNSEYEYFGVPITILFTWFFVGLSLSIPTNVIYWAISHLKEPKRRSLGRLFGPLVSTAISAFFLFIGWIAFGFFCGIDNVIPFAHTHRRPPQILYPLIIQVFVMTLLSLPFVGVVCFYSRHFNATNRITISNFVCFTTSLLYMGFFLCCAVGVLVTGTDSQNNILILSISAAVFLFHSFFHLLPYSQSIYAKCTGKALEIPESSHLFWDPRVSQSYAYNDKMPSLALEDAVVRQLLMEGTLSSFREDN